MMLKDRPLTFTLFPRHCELVSASVAISSSIAHTLVFLFFHFLPHLYLYSHTYAHIFAFLSFIVAHILYILTKNQELLTINLFHLYPHLY